MLKMRKRRSSRRTRFHKRQRSQIDGVGEADLRLTTRSQRRRIARRLNKLNDNNPIVPPETTPPPTPSTLEKSLQCVGNYCEYVTSNLPVMMGALSHAGSQLAQQNYGGAISALSRAGPYVQQQVENFRMDLSIVEELVKSLKARLSTLEKLPFAICSHQEIKRALSLIEDRVSQYSKGYAETQTSSFAEFKQAFYIGRNVEQFRTNLALDISLLMLSLVNLNQEVLLRQSQMIAIRNQSFKTETERQQNLEMFIKKLRENCKG